MKDVFPNSGRFSVTLDPTVNKAKVVRSRQQKRAQGKKRNKIEPIEEAAEGTEYEAQVVKVCEAGGGISRPCDLDDVDARTGTYSTHITCPPTKKIHKVLRRGLLLDVGLPVPAFLAHSAIPEALPLEVRLFLGLVIGVHV